MIYTLPRHTRLQVSSVSGTERDWSDTQASHRHGLQDRLVGADLPQCTDTGDSQQPVTAVRGQEL